MWWSPFGLISGHCLARQFFYPGYIPGSIQKLVVGQHQAVRVGRYEDLLKEYRHPIGLDGRQVNTIAPAFARATWSPFGPNPRKAQSVVPVQFG